MFSKHFDPAFQLFLHFALWCGNTLTFLSASLAKESPEGKASGPFIIPLLQVSGRIQASVNNCRQAKALFPAPSPEGRAISCQRIPGGPAQPLPVSAGAGMEGAGQQDLHVHGAAWLAHRLTAGWKVQEDTQKHHDQPDGHSGGRHQKTGERSGTVLWLWEWMGNCTWCR